MRARGGCLRLRALGAVTPPALLTFIPRPFISRARVVTLGLYLAPVTSRIVHEFQLHPVGIGEEHRVVILAIVGILGGTVEHFNSFAHQEFVERIDVGTRSPRRREAAPSGA